MIAKVVEIRDSGTFIPALAIQLGSDNDQERWLLAEAGYGRTKADQSQYVVLCKIAGGSPCNCAIDPFEWGQNPRTYFVAHRYIIDNFDKLEPGAIVDVEYILDITLAPKQSDRQYEHDQYREVGMDHWGDRER